MDAATVPDRRVRGTTGTDGPVNGNGAGRLSGRVLVLNATYEPIHVCSIRRAMVLLLKAKADLVERGEAPVRAERVKVDKPVVIKLRNYVRIPREVHRRKITRKAVLARDLWTCQYCGAERGTLTVDHVIPRSRGGESVWENIVASCAPCNRRKADRLPSVPGPNVFIRVAAPSPPPSWEPYLAMAA
jgi:5-methylcytosine-specific restriction endonuclease McrA